MDNGASSYRRFLEGDKSAFDEIMNEFFRSLVFFIDSYVHDVHTAEDIAIDVFSDLIVHKNKYNFKVKLKTYLFMLGRSRALDYIKHRKKIEFVELSQAQEIASEEASLEETVLADSRKRAVNSAVSKLPFDMRTAVHLVYFENMTYEETARIMKINKKRVDNLIYRAKKELKQIIGEDGELLI